jgi:hypothetical protein
VQYKPGDQLESTGQVISRVIGQGAHACVVITAEQQIRWEWRPRDSDTPVHLRPTIAAFVDLAALGRRVYLPGKRDGLRDDLAEALWASIDGSAGDHVTAPFQAIRNRLETRWRRLATVFYLVGAAVILLVSLIPVLYFLIVPTGLVRLVAAAVSGGAAGALLSILQRLPRLEVDPSSPLWYWSLEGSVRALLGMLSGMIICALVTRDVVFGFTKGTVSGLFLAGVLAGFVERLIPNLLVRMAEPRGKGIARLTPLDRA